MIADVSASGTVDTSTALYNVDNTNNPRSVVTTDGTSFYLSGQGVKGDATQGVFYAADGASSATAITTATDTRTVEIFNGSVYVSTDSKQVPSGSTAKATDNISKFSGEPTSAATPTALPGISQTVTLTAAQQNGVNNGSVGTAVYLSPENFFFANSTTLYVADAGSPKGGGIGDGGLQKWTLSGGTWTLDYTLSSGLNLVANSSANKNDTSGTTGLIGLTGAVNGNTVQLYATNATIGDTDQTYLYSIADTLNATTSPSGESFTKLMTAAADTNIRGVAFAPHTNAVVCFCTGTRILTARGEVAVEDLRVGDLAINVSGEGRPVRWIGHREVECRTHPRPAEIMPVRVAAGALGPNRPARDLWVSPGHALCLDVLGEVLVPASSLINGATVAQVEVECVTYWHVELDSHDILVSDGQPAESYMDCGNRTFFASGHGAVDPDRVAASPADYCRPFHHEGPLVEAVRGQLRARAHSLGWVFEDAADDDLHLVADGAVIRPDRHGNLARFVVPAAAADVFLASHTFMPARIGESGDDRTLGVALRGLSVDDGLGSRRDLALDDPRLGDGFSHVESDGDRRQRWTTGAARLPVELWAGCRGSFFLRLDLAAAGTKRWVAPEGRALSEAPPSGAVQRGPRLVLAA